MIQKRHSKIRNESPDFRLIDHLAFAFLRLHNRTVGILFDFDETYGIKLFGIWITTKKNVEELISGPFSRRRFDAYHITMLWQAVYIFMPKSWPDPPCTHPFLPSDEEIDAFAESTDDPAAGK